MGCSESHPQPVRRREQRKVEFDFENRERRHRKRKGHPEDEPDLRFKVDPVILDGPPQTYRSELSDDKVKQWKTLATPEEIRFKKAIYAGIHNMRLPDDHQECRIRGSVFLLNGNLLVCDTANFKIKLFNSEFKHLNHHTLPGQPHDLCVHSSNREGSDVFVTVPSDRAIHEFYVEDKQIVAGEILRTDGWCYGIAPFKTGLVVCVGTKIEFMDTDGKVLKTLQYDKNGNTKFGSPLYITVTAKYKLLVSDAFHHCVVCLNEDGDQLFKYTEISVPHNLIVDKEQNIYLSGSDKEAIDVLHQITRTGEKAKSLLSWRHVGFKPDTLCLREWDQLLVVGGDNDRIKTFRLVTRKTGRIYSNDAVMGDQDPVSVDHDGRSTPEVQELMKRILKT